MTRRTVFGTLGAVAAMPLFSRLFASRAADTRPNIIYIMTDDHCVQATSCYDGRKLMQTPNIDKMAAEGVRFDNFFVSNSLCAPSRATLLTGKYSHKNGQMTNREVFDGSQQTFPKLLQKAGYQTAMIGKWHLDSSPTGFDHWFVLPGQGDYKNPEFIDNGTTVTVQGYVTDIITDKAMEWIDNRDAGKPFCCLVHHKAPHRSWNPDKAHEDMFVDEEIPYPDTFDDDYSNRCEAAGMARMRMEHLKKTDYKEAYPDGLSEREIIEWKYQHWIKRYLRTVASVDDNIGRLLKYLDDNGLRDNTLIVYTSDNGFFLGEHNWFDKRFMYEESLRVPFVARFPGKIPAGSVCKDIGVNIDTAPTFLDFAGAGIPDDMQGTSLKPLMAGTTPSDWREAMYYHFYMVRGHNVQKHVGIRTDRYKLLCFYELNDDAGCFELFDLEKDPMEMQSVYDDPAYANIQKNMLAELAKLQKHYGDTEGLVDPSHISTPVQADGLIETPRAGRFFYRSATGCLPLPAPGCGYRVFDLRGRVMVPCVRAETGSRTALLPRHLKNRLLIVEYFDTRTE